MIKNNAPLSAFYELGSLSTYIFLPIFMKAEIIVQKNCIMSQAHIASGWQNWDLNSGHSIPEVHTKVHQGPYATTFLLSKCPSETPVIVLTQKTLMSAQLPCAILARRCCQSLEKGSLGVCTVRKHPAMLPPLLPPQQPPYLLQFRPAADSGKRSKRFPGNQPFLLLHLGDLEAKSPP